MAEAASTNEQSRLLVGERYVRNGKQWVALDTDAAKTTLNPINKSVGHDTDKVLTLCIWGPNLRAA